MTCWTPIQRGMEPDLSDEQREALREATPFVHWHLTQDDPELLAFETKGGDDSGTSLLRFPTSADFQRRSAKEFINQQAHAAFKAEDVTEQIKLVAAKSAPLGTSAANFFESNRELGKPYAGAILPLASHALRDQDEERNQGDIEGNSWIPQDFTTQVTGTRDPSARIADLPPETVIVGIIDDGIALGHARFRLPENDKLGYDTRFLTAWMQEGVFRKNSVVPFGRDIFRTEIQAAIKGNTKGGWLDEDSFNRQIHPAPTKLRWMDAARLLEGAAAHGTHVLDLACGHDPNPDPCNVKELRRQRIIAVSLPGRSAIGMAGTYLEFFVAHAMRRIVEMAEKLWQDIYPNTEGGFPVVINLSYGQQSGTKSGTSEIEKEFNALRAGRKYGTELHLVMPVGNDNLTRSNVRWQLKRSKGPMEESQKPIDLDTGWRILPQDQSSNFVEVWADMRDIEMAKLPKKGFPLEICLIPPGGSEDWITGKDNFYFESADKTARIYTSIEVIDDMSLCAAVERAHGGHPDPLGHRLRYVVAMRPTLDHKHPNRQARAGLWRIKVRWRNWADMSEDGREVYVNVQVDQNPSAASRNNFRSYFDHEKYRTHLPSGRVLDSFSYLPSEAGLANGGMNLARPDCFGHVQRQGSQNALANEKNIVSVTGHRESDGRPADFAATFYPKGRLSDEVKVNVSLVPCVSYPVDSGAAHLGILAAGPRSGSVISLRGTSFAAPQKSRDLIESLRAPHRSMAQGTFARRGAKAPDISRSVVKAKESMEKKRGFVMTRVNRRGNDLT